MIRRVRWCRLLAGVLFATSMTGSVAAAAGEGDVDLSVESANSSITAGQTGTQSFKVTNNGAVPTKGELTLKVVTPFFVYGVPDKLPEGCTMLLAKPDADIPQIVDCRIKPGIEPKDSRTVQVPLAVVTGAPALFLIGRSIVTPVPDSPDHEASIADNITPFGIQVSAAPAGRREPPDTNKINAYVWYDAPQLAPGAGRPTTLRVGNRGQLTKDVLRVTYLTPFFVNLTGDWPPGCERILANMDPTVPEVLSCVIPPGLGKAEAILQVPLALAAGGPTGREPGGLIVTPAPANKVDVDTEVRDNFVETAVVASS